MDNKPVNYEFCKAAAMVHLIESVRRHPCLWNGEAPEYKNKELKELAWCEVVKECALFDVREARRLWKNLRDGHRQALAIGSKTKWKYQDQMEFLLPTMAIRSLKRPREISPDRHRLAYMKEETNSLSEDSFSGEIQNENNVNDHSYALEFVAGEFKQEKKEIKIEIERESPEKETLPLESTSLNNDPLQTVESTYTLATTKVAHQNKALEKFFVSMFKTTNNLPEILQLQVQRQVFKIVMDTKEEYLTAKLLNSTEGSSLP